MFSQYKVKTTIAALALSLTVPLAVSAAEQLDELIEQDSDAFVVTPDGEELTLAQLVERSQVRIDEVVELPIRTLSAAHSSDGQVQFISENGRYVIVGELIDVWEQKALRTMQQIKESVKSQGLKPQLDTIAGSGNSVVIGNIENLSYIFVDPLCKNCSELIRQAKAIVDGSEEYGFEFIVMPALGEESIELATLFACSEQSDELKLHTLEAGTVEQLSAQVPCDTEKLERTILAAHLAGVDGVPFTVSHDDRVYRGVPADFKQWLDNQTNNDDQDNQE